MSTEATTVNWTDITGSEAHRRMALCRVMGRDVSDDEWRAFERRRAPAPEPDPVADDPRDLLARLLDLRGRFGMFDAIPVSQIDALTAATDSHPRATDHVVAILSRATGLPLDEATPVGHAEFAAARISNLAAACDERNALIDVLRAHGFMDRGAELAARLSAVLAAAREVADEALHDEQGPSIRARTLIDALAAADGAR